MRRKNKLISRDVFYIVLIILFAFILRFPYLQLPLERDEGGYAYVGWLWTSGRGIPYLSVFDHKPPIPFLISGLASLLAGNNFYSVRILSMAYFLILILTSFYFFLMITGRKVALLSTVLMIVYLSSIRLEGSYFNIEMQMIFPLLVYCFAIYWLSQKNARKRLIIAFIAGLSVFFAVFLKQVAVFPVAGLGLWLLTKNKKVKEILLMALGFFIPTLIVILYFGYQGAFDEAFRDLVVYNRGYTQEGLKPENIFIAGQAKGLLGYFNWITKMPPAILPLFLFSIAGLIFLRKQKSPAWWVSLILIVTLWVGIKTGGSREFPHYYLGLVLGLSFAFLFIADKMVKKKRKGLLGIVFVILIFWVVIPEFKLWLGKSVAIQEKQFGIQGSWFYTAPLVSEWIKENTKSNDTLLVWANEPEIYFYSGKIAPGGFMHFYGFYHLPGEKEKWLGYLSANPPDWIVTYKDDPGTYAELMDFLANKPFSYEFIRDTGYFFVLKKNEFKN